MAAFYVGKKKREVSVAVQINAVGGGPVRIQIDSVWFPVRIPPHESREPRSKSFRLISMLSGEINMLDSSVIRVLSALFTVFGVGITVLFFGLLIRKQQDLGSVKVSKPTGFVLRRVWLLLGFLPLIFYLLGATVLDWVYGTSLNLSFNGAEFLQVASVPIGLSGAVLFLWSGRALGQYMRSEIVVRERHELVTGGPYSRIRHPTYTSRLMMELGTALLFLHIVLVIGFLASVAMAHKRAVLEEELLASEEGFGQRYGDYMLRTGRFLPRLARPQPPRRL